jgi:hypothetical protein
MALGSAALGGTLVGIFALCLGTVACGTPPEQAGSSAEGIELTRVDIVQYTTPTLVGDPQQSSVRIVTVDLTLVFRFADHPATLVIDFESESGHRTHNELDLAALKPAILEATDGQWNLKAPVKISDLGSLRYNAVLVDQSGRASRAVSGSFTVLDSFSGSNGGQASEGNTTTVSGGP